MEYSSRTEHRKKQNNKSIFLERQIMSMKIIFMGTPEFAVHSLEVLKERGDEVMLVISQKDKPAISSMPSQPARPSSH